MTTATLGRWFPMGKAGKKGLLTILLILDLFGFVILFSYPPTLVEEPPRSILFQTGMTVKLPCVAEGKPKPQYTWYKDGKEFNWAADLRRFMKWPGEGTLQISQPTSSDTGVYQCVAFNKHGRSVSTTSFLLQAEIRNFEQRSVRTLSLPLGANVTLGCSVPYSLPPATVQWATLDKGKMDFISEDNRRAVDLEGNLHIASITQQDNGLQYMCTANNGQLRTLKSGEDVIISLRPGRSLPPRGPQLVYRSPVRQTVLQNDTLKLKCIFSGNPPPAITWIKVDPVRRNVTELPNTSVRNGGTELVVSPIGRKTGGRYRCSATNVVSVVSPVVKFEVVVQSRPIFLKRPEDTTVPLNGTHVFRCLVESNPTADIRWTINGRDPTLYLDGIRKRLEGNEMILTQLRPGDIAVFQCNASNHHGYAFADAYLNVMQEPPEFLATPHQGLRVAEHRPVNLTCSAFSAPKAKLSWAKDSRSLVDNSRYWVLDSGDLHIVNAQLDDTGSYECSARNPFGVRRATGSLIVRRRTQIIGTGPEETRVDENSQVVLTCQAKTDPLEESNLEVTWFRNNVPIMLTIGGDGAGARMTQSSSVATGMSAEGGGGEDRPDNRFRKGSKEEGQETALVVSSVRPEDSGQYTCNASNGLDFDTRTALLVIQGRPNQPLDIILDCTSSLRTKTALLSWQAGSDNNAQIIDYIIEYSSQYERDAWYSAEVVPVSPANRSAPRQPIAPRAEVRLRPHIRYQFRVRAKNRVGVSDASPASKTTCQIPAEKPNDNPRQLRVYGTKPDNLVIRWTSMAYIQHNGPNLVYVVTIECLDCDVIPRRRVNQSIIKDWQLDRLEISFFHDNSEIWPIETYKLFKVTIQSRNNQGNSIQPPNQIEGHSGESVPEIRPSSITMVKVDASEASMNWLLIDQASLKRVRGFFRGYRIEWCLAEFSAEHCERQKRYQDEIIQRPEGADLQFGRRRRRKRRSLATKRRSVELTAESIQRRKVRSLPEPHWGQTYETVLRNLPGLVRLKIWTRIINIQYAGPPSDIIVITTKEGVPGPVAEFTLVVAGVNHVEVAWAKPMQTNGNLTGYQMGSKELLGLEIGQLTTYPPLTDPEQLRDRIDALKPNTNYRVVIWALTKQGKGAESSIDIKTAPADQAPSRPTFVVQSIAARSINVSFEPNLSGDLNSVFYVQYRLPGQPRWEETQREHYRRWINVTGLQTDTYYYVRVVATDGGSQTAVSDTIRVKTGGPSGVSALRGAGATWFILTLLFVLAVIVVIVAFCFWRRRRLQYSRGKPIPTADPLGEYQTTPVQMYGRDACMTTFIPQGTLGKCSSPVISSSNYHGITDMGSQRQLYENGGKYCETDVDYPGCTDSAKRRSLLLMNTGLDRSELALATRTNGSGSCVANSNTIVVSGNGPPAYGTLTSNGGGASPPSKAASTFHHQQQQQQQLLLQQQQQQQQYKGMYHSHLPGSDGTLRSMRQSPQQQQTNTLVTHHHIQSSTFAPATTASTFI